METLKPRRGIIVSEIDKYIASFFFDDKGLKTQFTKIICFFFNFLKLKVSMKLEKTRIFILQFQLGNPRPNSKLFFQDANFLSAALTLKD